MLLPPHVIVFMQLNWKRSGTQGAVRRLLYRRKGCVCLVAFYEGKNRLTGKEGSLYSFL